MGYGGGLRSGPPARFETPDVSPGEIKFGKWFRKTYMRGLMPDADWLDPMTRTLFEIKDVSYPRSHFDLTTGGKGELRVNKVSLQNHLAIRGRYARVVVVLHFSDDQWLFGDLETVFKSGRDVSFSQIDDRPSLMVPLTAFKPTLEDVKP